MSWETAEALIAKALPNYERRESQHQMGLAAETALQNFQHLLAQAGTGTGKSYVGLAVAYYASKATGRPSVYSTAYKTLQDQIANKDAPFLAGILPDFTFTVLKGRSNYVCNAKLDELEDKFLKAKMVAELDENHNGEFDYVSFPLEIGERMSLTITNDECPGKSECPFGSVCHAEKAKTKAKTSNVIIVNHAVLATDLVIKDEQRMIGIPEASIGGILPKYDRAILDEGHEFFEFMTRALGGEISERTYQRLGSDVSKFLADRQTAVEINDIVNDLFNSYTNILKKSGKTTLLLDDALLNSVVSEMDKLINKMTALQGQIENTRVVGDDKMALKKKRLVRRLERSRERLTQILTMPQDVLVRSIERDEKDGTMVKWAPLGVADFLNDNLWSHSPSLVMSASLAVGKDFDYVAEQLGIDNPATFDAETPFDFSKQAITYIPQIVEPTPANLQQWRAQYIAEVIELVKASNGRALLLFTSKTEMKEAHKAISPSIKRMGHKILMQGEMSNKVLSKTFAEDEHSVLFATKSFFTGIDVQGNALRLVVINKLPFAVPTDVFFKARANKIDKGLNPFRKGGSFWKLSVPMMVLTLVQGYGRLIRTVSDGGVVAIMDSRLMTKGYGSVIIGSLPDAPVVRSLDDACDFLKNLEAV